MAFESNYVTMIGNLTADPELRFTASGVAVCGMRIACNRRYTDRSGQQQEETTFMNVNLWRDMAENVAESLNKGDRVIVIGRLRVRSYEPKDGSGTRWVTEIEADEVSPSLRWARCQVAKTSGNGAGGYGNRGGGSTPAAPAADAGSVDEIDNAFSVGTPGGGGDEEPLF